MMPGETHSKTAGLATEGTGLACQNCSALQQNLNEYVGALIALKQKIIETDHLLTKYQQKCNELQFTERENGMLRHQLEQMLQKFASHDHCQGEFESLQAELEEKKSSLKIYQHIQEEYIRIKEECEQSDIGKKKLESRVKKLEDATAKHNSEVKQLKMEKKVIEKELKKTQEKLEGFQKQQIIKKKMKNAVTQFASEEPLVMVDKSKIKRLLEELWVCFDSATQEQKNKDVQSVLGSLAHSGEYFKGVETSKGNRLRACSTSDEPAVTEKVARKRRKSRKSIDYIPPTSHSSLLEASEMPSSETVSERDNESEEVTRSKQNKSFEDGGPDVGDSAFYEDRTTDISVRNNFACSSLHCSDQDDDDDDDEELGDKLHHVLYWARPLPPLLSPVQLSPSCTQDALFGELTDSSDGEMDCRISKMPPLSDDGTFECQINCTIVGGKEEHEETAAYLSHELETVMQKHTAPDTLGDARSDQSGGAAKLTNLDNLKSLSVGPVDTVDPSEQKKMVTLEHTSTGDNEQVQIETTENLLMNSKRCQAKTNELVPSPEKICSAENTLNNSEHPHEESSEVEQLEELTCENEKGYPHLEKCSGQMNVPVGSSVTSCLTKDSCVKLDDSPAISEKAVFATKNNISVLKRLSDKPSNALQFEVAPCSVKDSLTTPENSQLMGTVQTCTSFELKNSVDRKSEPILTKETVFSSAHTLVISELSEVDPEKDATSKITVVLGKASEFGTETECKLMNSEGKDVRFNFEHSYSSVLPDSTSVIKRNSCEHRTTDKNIEREIDSLKDQKEIITVPTEIATSVQNFETMYVAPTKTNVQDALEMGKTVTPTVSLKNVASKPFLSKENPPNDSQINTKLPNTPLVHTLECADNVSVVSKDNIHVGKLAQSQTQLLNSQTKHEKLQFCRLLQLEERIKPKLKSPSRPITMKKEKPLPSEEATHSLMVEPGHSTPEIRNSMHPERASIIEFKKSVSQITERDIISVGVCCIDKNVSTKLASATEKDTKRFEKKISVENCVPCTDFKSDAVPSGSGYVKTNCTEIDGFRNDLEDKCEEMSLKSWIPDKCVASVVSACDLEQSLVNAKEAVSQSTKLNNEVTTCISHEEIAVQFAIEAAESGKKVLSRETKVVCGRTSESDHSFDQPCEKSINQKFKGIVASEMHPFPKSGSKYLDGRTSDNGKTNLLRQSAEDAGVEKITGSHMFVKTDNRDKAVNAVVQSKVIIETPHELTSPILIGADFANGVHIGNHSILIKENLKDDLIIDQTYLDFSVLSKCSAVALQHRTKATNPLKGDNSGGLVSMNILSQGSDKMKNVMKGLCEEEPAEYPIYPNMSVFRSAEQPTKFMHSNALSSNTIKISKGEVDSDLEDDFPVRKVSNTNRRNTGKANGKNYWDDVAKVTEMMKCITTTNTQEDCKIQSLLSSDDRSADDSVAVTHLKAVSPANVALCVEINKATTSVLSQTKVNHDQQAICSFEANSVALSNLAENNSEEQKEIVSVTKFVGVKSCTLPQPAEAVVMPCRQSSAAKSTSESNSVQDRTLAENVHKVNDLAVKNCELVVDQTVPDRVVKIKNVTKDTSSKEKLALKRSQKAIWLESFGLSKVNVNNSSNNKIPEALKVLPKNSGITVSEAPNNQPRIKIAQVRDKVKTPQSSENQPILANADTSTTTKHSPDTISKVRSEMGPPLPPLLPPLIATPPRTLRPISPIMSTSSRSSLPSPLDDLISPLRETPVAPLMSPLSDDQRYKSLFTTPSPSEMSSKRIVSSPLQFCAATPKHALPVPGRLPPSASANVTPGMPQENSVRILDSMYPELSAQARTLNILKGNIQLSGRSPAECKHLPGPVTQITGFKTITSASTAFVKTGKSSKSDSSSATSSSATQRDIEQPSVTSLCPNAKRTIMVGAMPRSAKRLCLGNDSPNPDIRNDIATCFNKDLNVGKPMCNRDSPKMQVENTSTNLPANVHNISDPNKEAVKNALKKIGDSCFDLLPVIRSNVLVGNISMVPIMRDEEKEVVREFTITKRDLAESLMHAIVKKLKGEMMSLDKNYLQALCRVYIGICRQLGDLEKARVFCYSILKEDFPESDKLTLFIVSVWQETFSLPGVINKAMQSLVKHRAKGDVLMCLTAYLKWVKGSPLNVGIVLSSVLMAIQLCPNMKFQSNEQHGEDLCDGIWEYVFAIDLLCCHRKWAWTHDNVISKELWPIMDKWVKHRKGHVNVSFTPDIIVAAVLRLIGRLSQIGLKEGFVSAVKNISSVISAFIQHAKEEDMPWGVQLASIYTLCDLASSDPAGILETLQIWRRTTTNHIPPAITSSIAEITSLCMLQN